MNAIKSLNDLRFSSVKYFQSSIIAARSQQIPIALANIDPGCVIYRKQMSPQNNEQQKERNSKLMT